MMLIALITPVKYHGSLPRLFGECLGNLRTPNQKIRGEWSA
jgi:hypothetical protein